MINISLAFSCFIFLTIIAIVYFSKQRIQNTDNKIFAFLIIHNLIGICIDIVGFFLFKLYGADSFINILISKIFVLYFIFYLFCLTLYVYNISYNQIHKLFKYLLSLLGLISISILFLPITITLKENVGYSSGPATSVGFVIVFSTIIIIIGILLLNIKKIINKKYMPIFAFIFLIFGAFALQRINPEINLLLFCNAIVTTLMFFTIENPDVKLIEQLNVAKDAAEKANYAKTEFLSNMSHEIRTPLNAIVGFSECMLSSNDLKETKEFAKDVVDASKNLLEIVNGILDISKIEANKMEIINKEYNPREVFNSLCKLITPRISEKPIEFKVNISEDLPGVLKGDMGKVKQIILNLLTNATKYTEKGTIEFNITCINRQDIHKCSLYIAIKDTGRGIKKENLSKLFNKFERIDEDKNTTIEGTGLGLAITKSLTEMMGGTITVNSKLDEGSTFRIFLEQEIISMEIPKSSSEEIEIDYNSHNGKRILIVDDSKINLKVANQILKPYNFNVKLAESGYEAIELLENSTFDLILMDIMMPKMNGIETLKRLQKMDGFDIPVVALTADAIEGTDEKYLNAGFNAYLSKPIDRYELDRILNKYLGDKENE